MECDETSETIFLGREQFHLQKNYGKLVTKCPKICVTGAGNLYVEGRCINPRSTVYSNAFPPGQYLILPQTLSRSTEASHKVLKTRAPAFGIRMILVEGGEVAMPCQEIQKVPDGRTVWKIPKQGIVNDKAIWPPTSPQPPMPRLLCTRAVLWPKLLLLAA